MTGRGIRWPRTPLVAAPLAIAVGCFMVGAGGAASPTNPPVVMLVNGHAVRVDARTLRPLRGGWSRAVGTDVSMALSPSGTRIAVAGPYTYPLVLDTATGRVLRQYRLGGNGGDLYWLGGDDPWARDALLVTVDFGCESSGCEWGIKTIGRADDDGFDGDNGGLGPALKGGLVFEEGELYVFGRKGFALTIPLRKLPTSAPVQVVADVARDRLFAVSSAGVVAKIEHVTHKPRVSYHRVDLNGGKFGAAWAGADKIALWGADGLGTIDTRTWKTRAIAQGVESVVATRPGIAAWSKNLNGLTVYSPGGARRFHVLEGQPILNAQAVGEYLYVSTAFTQDIPTTRYSVNLRTGKVVGPLHRPGWIATPTLVPIP